MASALALSCGGREEAGPQTAPVDASAIAGHFERMGSVPFDSLRAEVAIEIIHSMGAGEEAQEVSRINRAQRLALSRPNRLRLELVSETLGPKLAVSDGEAILWLDGDPPRVTASPAPGTLEETPRVTLGELMVDEANLVVSLLGWPPPHEDLLALPTPEGTAPFTLEESAVEIDGALCDVIEINVVSHGRNTLNRYSVDRETGMLRRFELHSVALDSSHVIDVSETFALLEIDAPIPDEEFAATPPTGLPISGLFRSLGEAPADLGDLMNHARAAVADAASAEGAQIRQRVRGEPDTFALEIALERPNRLLLGLNSPRWPTPARMVSDGSELLVVEALQNPDWALRVPAPDDFSEYTSEHLSRLGVESSAIVLTLMGANPGELPLDGEAARAGEAEIGGRVCDLVAIASDREGEAASRHLLAFEREGGALMAFETWIERDPGHHQRTLSEQFTSLDLDSSLDASVFALPSP